MCIYVCVLLHMPTYVYMWTNALRGSILSCTCQDPTFPIAGEISYFLLSKKLQLTGLSLEEAPICGRLFLETCDSLLINFIINWDFIELAEFLCSPVINTGYSLCIPKFVAEPISIIYQMRV